MTISRPALGAPIVEQLSRKYPKHLPTSVVIGNSQTRYLFEHFDPYLRTSPAFITIRGATTFDIERELANIPRSVTTLVLHLGASELERFGCEETLRRFRRLVNNTLQARPELTKLVVTLVLPRFTNRRLETSNHKFVHWFNNEARQFNETVKTYCQTPSKVTVLDHEFTSLPPRRFLAADGLHPSFPGVALIAQNLKGLLQRGGSWTSTGWSSEIPADRNPSRETPAVIPMRTPTGRTGGDISPRRLITRQEGPIVPARQLGSTRQATTNGTTNGDGGLDINEYPTPAESFNQRRDGTPPPGPPSGPTPSSTGRRYYLRNSATPSPHVKED